MSIRDVGMHVSVAEPAPAGGGAGSSEAADLLTEEERARMQRKARLVVVILVICAAIVAALVYRAVSGHSAIPGIGKPLLPHYAGSIYGMNRPIGVAVSPSGLRLYVTESDGNRLVRVYDRSGKQVDVLKPPGRTLRWRSPVYVAVDPLTDDVYVSDRLRATVDIYTAAGAYRGRFRPLAKRHHMTGLAPLGLAFDRQGNFYMTDVGDRPQRVLVFGRDRKLLRTLGSGREFSFPNGVALHRRGDLYVSDSNHGRLAIFNKKGKLVASIRRGVGEGDLGLPRGVAIAAEDRLYVVDATAQVVKAYRIPATGPKVPIYIGSFGQEGQKNGMFEYPNAIAVDGLGWIYVTDRENDRVQVWRR